MKVFNLTTLLLIVIGGLNWGLVGVADTDLVASIFGAHTAAANFVYALIGVSALWQLVALFKAMGGGEVRVEANKRAVR